MNPTTNMRDHKRKKLDIYHLLKDKGFEPNIVNYLGPRNCKRASTFVAKKDIAQ